NSVGAVLKPAGLEASKGLISTFYLKDPTDPQWKNDQGYKDWVAFMDKYYPDGNKADLFNVYGYTVAQSLVQVLKQCGNDLSRTNIMKQAASLKDLALPMFLPGIKINTSPTDFYPVEQEQLARFDGERWVLFGETYDASKKKHGRRRPGRATAERAAGGRARMRLHGKVALVTGAGSGIGQASARLFAREGAKVAVLDIRQDAAKETVRLIEAEGGEALAVAADVTRSADNEAAVGQAVSRWGRLDILFANAGVPQRPTPLQHVPPPTFAPTLPLTLH